MPSRLQRLTNWLCLVVALFAGIAPVQGVVLCLEPDGDLCVEVASSTEACSGCEIEGRDAKSASEHEVSTDDPCCTCLDIAVPGLSQDRQVLPRVLEFQLGPWIACVEPLVLALAPSPRVTPDRTRGEEPRPPDSLALIRTVVLLV